MPRLYVSGIVPAPVEEVWAKIRDFNDMPSWHPNVEKSSLDTGASGAEMGAVRRLVLADGREALERLVALDDGDHTFTYELTESPFPGVRRYVATLRLAPVTRSNHTFLEWWSEYDTDAEDEAGLTQTFTGAVYESGIEALQECFKR
jgi:Polyketide cyclase / dehydrase and lipid transport